MIKLRGIDAGTLGFEGTVADGADMDNMQASLKDKVLIIKREFRKTQPTKSASVIKDCLLYIGYNILFSAFSNILLCGGLS